MNARSAQRGPGVCLATQPDSALRRLNREHTQEGTLHRKLALFTAATYLFSWACWWPIIDSLESSPFAAAPVTLVLFFLGAYGPALIGIAMTSIYGGRSAVKSLFRCATSLRIGSRWLLVVVLAGAVIVRVRAGAAEQPAS